jgi:hypothetical protein
MSKILLLLCLGMSCLWVQAQNPARVTIKGSVQDTSGTSMPAATVMLLQPKDSALVNFTRSDEKGSFEFRNVKNTPYLLKIVYLSYLPLQELIPVSSQEINDLGIIRIKPIAKELIEVVIKAARAPLSIKGDTIEYDARAFRVPPGSTVEDLLRRLPGIEVDGDGNIKAQGKDIKRVTVDGKTFFGDDPKAATKNLGAETISKVQVFNDKSEQAKLTGVDDGKREKTMNLELKDEFKKGAFGKLTVAGGTQERWAARGNYNRFNKKEQFSIIGYGNNINETGVNWEDYGEFKGNNTFNDFDNGDFGFGGNRRFFFVSDDIMNNFDGRGFTKNAGAGVNYNYTHQKTKLSTSYFYNQTRLTLDQFSNRQTFLQNGSFFTQDTLGKVDFRGNHSIAMRVEQMLDSSNTVIAKGNLRFSNNDVTDSQSQRFLTGENEVQNTSRLTNGTDQNTFTFTSAVIYRHKFKKKGRNFAVSGGYNASSSNGNENLNSLNRFFATSDPNEQIRAISQLNDNYNQQNQLKSSVLYLEPLSKKFYWETFYNVSRDSRVVDRQAYNKLQNNNRIDSLSTYYTNTILYNRVGSSVRYSHAGINISTGLAALRYDLNGDFARSKERPMLSSIDRNFSAWTPNLSVDIEFKNNAYFSTGYDLNVSAPQLNDLQPVVNNNNPFFITQGNPDLLPEKSHQMRMNFSKFDPATFRHIGFGVDYNYYLSQIIYTQTVDENLVTRTRPQNIAGGNQLSVYTWMGMPIIKTKLTLNGNLNYNRGFSPTFINGIQNETNNQGYGISMGLNIIPNEKMLFNVRGNLNFNTIQYSIETRQNQDIQNHGLDVSMKWNFAKKLFFESNLDYNHYRNDRFGFNQDIPIFNASVRRLFLKDNKLEMRLAAFDIFNKRRSIVQQGNQNYVYQQTALTLARYFMLSVSYNMRGHADKIKKNGW